MTPTGRRLALLTACAGFVVLGPAAFVEYDSAKCVIEKWS
jgi:hypothetical protein